MSFQPHVATIRDYQKLAIRIDLKPFNPQQLTEVYLKQHQIIPVTWTAKSIDHTLPIIQLQFKEGLTAIAQPNQIIFQEKLNFQQLNTVNSPTIASQWLMTQTNKDYQTLQLSFQREISLNKVSDFGLKYLTKTLLSPSFPVVKNAKLMGGQIRYIYPLKDCQFTLTVQTHQMPRKNSNPVSGLIFRGNFRYVLINIPRHQRRNQLQQFLSHWQKNYQRFIEIIDTHFLS